MYQSWLRGEESIAALSRRFGVSRKTAYKWLGRGGFDGEPFADRSRRPRSNPRAVDEATVDLIISMRKAHPSWGPRKLRDILAKVNPRAVLPAVATFAAIFKRHGLVTPRRQRVRTPPHSSPLAHAKAPNDLWCVDFKGDFDVGGRRCYPLTVTDAFSRYLIACVDLTNTRSTKVRREFERIFAEFGLPKAIRSDNGSPFASKAIYGFSKLSIWWWKLGIRHERIEPGKPQQNGSHERMHLTLQQDTASSNAKTIRARQRVSDRFRHQFNDVRPHEALGMKTPSQFYSPSLRRLPHPPWGNDYEYDFELDVARVSKAGTVRTAAGSFFVSTAFEHELLAIKPQRKGRRAVYFGQLCLGTISRSTAKGRRVIFHPSQKPLPMSLDHLPPMLPE